VIDLAQTAAVFGIQAKPSAGDGARLLWRLRQADESLVSVLKRGFDHWCLIFSGGKDSTAAVVVALETALKKKLPVRRIDVVYADTMMEIPVIQQYALGFLRFIQGFERLQSLPIFCHVVRPPLEERFWVCLLGKGYPPPHQKFRWCTKRLKIEPIEAGLKSHLKPNRTVIVTGVRFGESSDRDRRLNHACHRGGECGQGAWFQYSTRLQAAYLAPLAYWRECDVWDLLNLVAPQWGYPTHLLERDVYNGRGTRFGCWMCTVVRQDKAMEKITALPQWSHLRPLLEFRQRVKDVTKAIESRVLRQDGKPGKLSLETRRKLLDELLSLQSSIKMRLISKQEVALIQKLWEDERFKQ